MRASGISFKHYLFFSFLLLSWLPVAGFAYWTYQGLIAGERAEVHDRHLLTSRHVSLALARYARDAESAFILANAIMSTPDPDPAAIGSVLTHLSTLGFRHVCFVDSDRRILEAHCAFDCALPGAFNERLWADLADVRQRAAAKPGTVVWSGVVQAPSGEPRIYVAAQVANGLTAIGELSTEYFLSLQRAVRFGKLGHAAIVDGNGRVIAHPKKEWVESRQDLSAVAPVQAMLRGESGVAEFFSPALQASMIAGYSTVAPTGWGIMVPQPVGELYAYADRIAWIAGLLSVAAMIATGMISWLLARGLSGSLQPLLQVADRISAGDLSARVGSIASRGPREVKVVSSAVDQMMDRLAAATAKQMQAYAELDRAKSELLAHVSHELRTPLNAIIGFSDIIRRQMFGPVGTERYIEYARDITSSGNHLLRLVDQLLEVARDDLEAGGSREDAVDLRTVIGNARGIAAAATPGARDWIEEFDEDLPAVRGNPHQLTQMMINLLENAGKYSEDGTRILTQARRTAEGDILIRVLDHGIGMSETEQDSCMTPFGRGTSPFVRSRKGAGLGLSVVASVAATHGFSISIDSAPGDGTTVSILVPKDRLA